MNIRIAVGFTLIEMLVVLAVIAILATLVMLPVESFPRTTKRQRCPNRDKSWVVICSA
ncbi:MAG: prepilin-type N-terminal cleavage/methylation domain-containing protein [Bermanella sp.]|jgi:prepilin-type N-terminal cleavage/methylation domain-containing protein